jgi:hypothetical protein
MQNLHVQKNGIINTIYTLFWSHFKSIVSTYYIICKWVTIIVDGYSYHVELQFYNNETIVFI